jgi:hypothetical protein
LETTPSKPEFAGVLQDDLAIACLMAVELKGRPADQQWLKQRLRSMSGSAKLSTARSTFGSSGFIKSKGN